MHHKIPAMIIDPIALFREGLSRILQEANFNPVWCSDRPPVGQLRALSGQVSFLLIIGTEIEEAIVQIAEVKRIYPISRVVLTAGSCVAASVRSGDSLRCRRQFCPEAAHARCSSARLNWSWMASQLCLPIYWTHCWNRGMCRQWSLTPWCPRAAMAGRFPACCLSGLRACRRGSSAYCIG